MLVNWLTSKITYRIVLSVIYITATIIFCLAIFLSYDYYGSSVFFVICGFMSFMLATTTYGEVLITVPHSIVPVVAGFPTSTRMIGSSVAYALSSCLYDMFYESDKPGGYQAVLVA